MIRKPYSLMMIFCMSIGAAFSSLNGCMITLINDGNRPIMVRDKNDKNVFSVIAKNGRRRIGKSHQLAYFDIYVQQPKTQNFALTYTCRQKECGKNGNPHLRFSDLGSNGKTSALFMVVHNKKPHTSMVRGLPMIQKTID